MRIGLIGRGRWGQVYARTLAELGVSPAWVCGKDDLRYDADAVIIATPAETHRDVALDALDRGVHVLLEKPFAMSLASAEDLLARARTAGVVAWCGYTHLYSPAWRKFKRDAGSARGGLGWLGGPCPAPKWWCKGSHAVAMALDMFGQPRWARLQPRANGQQVLRVKCELGTAALFVFDEQCTPYFTAGVSEYQSPITAPTSMQVLCKEFLQACTKGEPDVSGFELGLRVTQVLTLAGCPL